MRPEEAMILLSDKYVDAKIRKYACDLLARLDVGTYHNSSFIKTLANFIPI